MNARYTLGFIALFACTGEDPSPADTHGPIAPDIQGALGDPLPNLSADQLATFTRGRDVANRRFTRADGLGPTFNLTSCAGCHEKPATGGSSGLYRNFFLSGTANEDGTFTEGTSAGKSGGVIRLYSYDEAQRPRPEIPATTNVFAQRNAIPFFGVGLLAELTNDDLLVREDPADADGDGISGKANWDQGFVGRFGMKSQTVSIEGFIRGPLFNHLGVTTDPLTEEQKAALPVDSSSAAAALPVVGGLRSLFDELLDRAQAAAPAAPLTDDDGVADPEMSTSELFDLVSFAMLTAAPAFDVPTPATTRGLHAFDAAGCAGCHTPRVHGKRGPIPVYSDLLLHDMGPELADGIRQKEATGAEFRTQPLWGVAAEGPYLHDGRAPTLHDAILWHGGEAQDARDAYADLDPQTQDDLVSFLRSLGGNAQVSAGLIPPGDTGPAAGALGGPRVDLNDDELARYREGRLLFDTEFFADRGVGAPRFNGDSCRACHFEPVIGGAGPRDVNVTRHGLSAPDGRFMAPDVGTILHRVTAIRGDGNRPQAGASIFEMRQTPHLFGLGLIEDIPDDVILAGADPYDLVAPWGVSGKPSWVDGGRLGRFGWKAQVPSIAEFVRDAVTAELGMTLPYQAGFTFGRLQDNDEVADPELTLAEAAGLEDYLRFLAPPPRNGEHPAGEALFADAGCADCHTPALDGVPLFSDLLLHAMLPPGARGVEDASATETEFRTAPLWGLAHTAPYLHDGRADTLDAAIRGHDGEAVGARDRALSLTVREYDALLAFLETL